MNEEPETVIIKGSSRKFIEKFLPDLDIDLRKRMPIKKARELYSQAVVASRFHSLNTSGIGPGSKVVRKLSGGEVYTVDRIDEAGFVYLEGITEEIQPQELENIEHV